MFVGQCKVYLVLPADASAIARCQAVASLQEQREKQSEWMRWLFLTLIADSSIRSCAAMGHVLRPQGCCQLCQMHRQSSIGDIWGSECHFPCCHHHDTL